MALRSHSCHSRSWRSHARSSGAAKRPQFVDLGVLKALEVDIHRRRPGGLDRRADHFPMVRDADRHPHRVVGGVASREAGGRVEAVIDAEVIAARRPTPSRWRILCYRDAIADVALKRHRAAFGQGAIHLDPHLVDVLPPPAVDDRSCDYVVAPNGKLTSHRRTRRTPAHTRRGDAARRPRKHPKLLRPAPRLRRSRRSSRRASLVWRRRAAAVGPVRQRVLEGVVMNEHPASALGDLVAVFLAQVDHHELRPRTT